LRRIGGRQGDPEVVSVAAIDSSSAHASFSNANSGVEVSAAGAVDQARRRLTASAPWTW
jgi:hypothetical protein